MVKSEPKNPIRCMYCNLIFGVQGLSNHIRDKHQEQYSLDGYAVYATYVKENAVKKNDLNNPLRAEWRLQNNVTQQN